MSDTWRQCQETGDAIVDCETADGEVVPLRVPWEHRHTSLGWGRRRRAVWGAAGQERHAVVVSEGSGGVLARDEHGTVHALPHGSFRALEWPKLKQQPLAKALVWIAARIRELVKGADGRVWVAPHQRQGAHVEGYWREVKHGETYPIPEAWGGTATVRIDGDQAEVEHGGKAHQTAHMPADSVAHYLNDTNHALPHPPTSGDPAIDGVLSGRGQRIAKGNDGIVYRSPTGEAVKVSTTTPYQPLNRGHRTPEQAVSHLRHEYDVHQALHDVPHVPKVRWQEHDGRGFLVKPWAPEEEKFTPAELDSIAVAVAEMHKRGWTLNDTVQMGRDATGKLWFIDLGQAQKHASAAAAAEGGVYSPVRGDLDRLDHLFHANGHKRGLQGEEAVRRFQYLSFVLKRGPRKEDTGIDGESRRAQLAEWEDLEPRVADRIPMRDHDATDKHWNLTDQIRDLWKQPQPLEKAKAIPPGARWITVHPSGPGSEGHPILVMPAGDGTHRVIGGAGGSMTHLRLKLGSPEDWKRKAEEHRKAKAEKRKGMSKEEREAEKTEKEARQARVKTAERKVVEKVREKWGGIDEDLTDEDTAGLSEKAATRVKNHHHRKQFRQAMKARKDMADKLAGERMEQIADEAAVDEAIREDPDTFTEAQAAGRAELALIAEEEESRTVTRSPRRDRSDSETRARQATATAQQVLGQVDREAIAAQLEEQGGRSDAGAILGETASAEQRRRAAQLLDDAVILADAAEGKPPEPTGERAGVEHETIRKAIERAGVDASDHDAVKEALANEARIAMERAQLAQERAKKWEALEAEGPKGATKAIKQLIHTDVQRGLTEEVRDAARKLGLREDAKVPLKQAEIAELVDTLGSFEELRRARKGLDEVAAKAEGPKSKVYDKSRRAFTLATSEPTGEVLERVEEQVRRELATRLIGLADEKSSAHAQAVADGHFARLADVSLAVDNASHVDRQVVDAIGLKNAAVLMRHALESRGHDASDLHDALVGSHIRDQVKLTQEALRQADAFVPHIEEAIENAADVEHGMAQLDASEADLHDAQRAIGSALGSMEATATLAQTMRGKQPEHLSIELKDKGGTTVGNTLTWMHSIGLAPGDYEIDTENKEVRIPKASWSKLINTTDEKVVESRKFAHAIKRGDHDEEGWLPAGMVSRTSSSFTDPPPNAPRYHTGLDLNADDIHGALADHIGSRLADGERPADIQSDLLSATVAGKAADPAAFAEMAREFFPLSTPEDEAQHKKNAELGKQKADLTEQYHAATAAGDDAKVADLAGQISALEKPTPVLPKRDVDFADHYENLSKQYLQRHHPEAATINAASLYGPGVEEKDVREAVFRTLAANPEHSAAFTPLGELTPAHQQVLQDHFYKRAGIEKTRDWSEEFTGRRKALVEEIETKGQSGGATGRAAEAAGQGGMFGGGGGMFGGGTPTPPPKKLSEETVGELHPEQAKALAYEYPREGREIHEQAMGPRPADVDPASSKLHPDVHAAIDAVRERHPAMVAHELTKAAALHIGRQKALKEAGVTEDALRQTDATGELTPAARKLAGTIEVRAADLQQRGIDPREVQRVYGGRLHDAEREAFEAHAKKHSTPWASFIDTHGDRGVAYQALQQEMRGDFAAKMAEHYGKVTGKPLQTGIAEVPNASLHAAAITSPAQRKELAEQRRQEVQAARVRAGAGERSATGEAVGGRFGQGSALERYRAAKDAERSHAQRQGGLFGAAPPPPGNVVALKPAEKRKPGPGERVHLGAKAENEIESILSGNLGKNLDPKKPVNLLTGVSMDGRRIHSQRVIKMLRRGKRMGAWLGTGSGKTALSIGAFTDLHHTGDTTHGLYLVPKAVQGQFGGEMLNVTEPGRYRFDTGAGKSHAERAAMLADKGTHMRVMTHASATKTILKLAADHHKIAPEAMLERLRGMNPKERAEAVRTALDARGIPRHMTYLDEGHLLTTRAGQAETAQSIVLGAMTHPVNATHFLDGTATPYKNDTSEIYSTAKTLDPDRYHDAYKFQQDHGVGTTAAPDAIRRELDHMTYTASIPPDGVERIDTPNPVVKGGKKVPGGHVPLDPKHAEEMARVETMFKRATAAHARGDTDLEAVKALSPGRFRDAPEADHEQLARDVGPALGIVKNTAVRKALQLAPIEHNAKLRRMTDVIKHDTSSGRPSIVFSDSAEEVHHVAKTLAAQGIAAGVYHGGLNDKERETFVRDFKAGKFKVSVMTAAGEAGINLQNATVTHHYDQPDTAKSWTQRNGRAYRQGQTQDCDTHDWSFDHEHDTAGIRRIQTKSRLADVHQTPLGPLDEHGFAHDYAQVLAKKHQSYDPEGAIAAK